MAEYGRQYRGTGEEERLLGNQDQEQDQDRHVEQVSLASYVSKYRWTLVSVSALLGVVIFAAVYLIIGHEKFVQRHRACNSIDVGYNCFPDISHRWGQYSPYFSVEEGVSNTVPENCQLTFVQMLSRHGARHPTYSKSLIYAELVEDIQTNATAFRGSATFLRDYVYTLGSDELTVFGERQMVSSGVKFYQRYADLTRTHVPFIRASDKSRVVESGRKFILGFQQSKNTDRHADRQQTIPKIDVIISEEVGFNNTLNHNTCCAFEHSAYGDAISENYTAILAPPIARRLETDLPGVTFSNADIVHLMDMCPFDTVASTPEGTKESAFCNLFTADEWSQYNYLASLSKYYTYGSGHPLGPTQGVGFVNELIARLTNTPVQDNTSTNTTLDAPDAPTFPLNRTLYADFTHDNGLLSIFFALGLYNGTQPLPHNHIQSDSDADGYSVARAVPFGARAYIEMMECASESEPLVRVLVNDRVVPLHGCPVDKLGRCRRDEFVEGLSFARSGGFWERCSI